MKRYTLNSESYYGSDKKQVVDCMQDYRSSKEKYGEKTGSELREALVADNSDWIFIEAKEDLNKQTTIKRPE